MYVKDAIEPEASDVTARSAYQFSVITNSRPKLREGHRATDRGSETVMLD
jgi:hypothetical protein